MRPDVAAPVTGALAAGTWIIEPAQSTARFCVRDKLVATTRGTIPVRSGAVRLGADGAVESARVELDVDGIGTGNDHRDRDLRKPRFLSAVDHPVIVVESGPAPAVVEGWRLAASLTARGATVPLDLVVELTDLQDGSARVRIVGRLDRTCLRMKVPTFIVGRMVDIDVDAVFRRGNPGA